MQADAQLTAHFHLSEFTSSQTATRLGIRNEPLSEQVANLARLASCLEDVRFALNSVPIVISSGFRSPELNRVVGGTTTPPSAHMDGRAADFTAPAYGTPRQICRRLIDSGLLFDQLIFEGNWVHFGIAPRDVAPRRQVLTAVFAAHTRPRYTPGLT